jgi:hypothetical protein
MAELNYSALHCPDSRSIISGSHIKVEIQLSEPTAFLKEYDKSNPDIQRATVIRGNLVMKLSEPTRIKKVSTTLHGSAKTSWADGKYLLIPTKMCTETNDRFRYYKEDQAP